MKKTEDYQIAFASIKAAIESIYDVTYDPNTIMSDAAPAIRNGFKAVFGDEKTVLMCWFHVRKNINMKLNLVLNKTSKDEILSYIDLI